MRSYFLAIALLVLPLLWSLPARAIDCAQAEGVVDRGVCADPALLALHTEMEQALEAARCCAGLERDQMLWQRRRDRTCTEWPEAACLEPLYRDRIDLLRQIAMGRPAGWFHYVLLEGEWRVVVPQGYRDPGPGAAWAIPVGSTLWHDHRGLCVLHPGVRKGGEACGGAIGLPEHGPLDRTDITFSSRFRIRGVEWRLQLRAPDGTLSPLNLLSSDEFIAWTPDQQFIQFWRPLKGAGYRVVGTEGPVR